jgi:hypothetical protein
VVFGRARGTIGINVNVYVAWISAMLCSQPFLKALFDRGKDWVDIEEMHVAGTIDIAGGSALIRFLGAVDERVRRLRMLRRWPTAPLISAGRTSGLPSGGRQNASVASTRRQASSHRRERSPSATL